MSLIAPAGGRKIAKELDPGRRWGSAYLTAAVAEDWFPCQREAAPEVAPSLRLCSVQLLFLPSTTSLILFHTTHTYTTSLHEHSLQSTRSSLHLLDSIAPPIGSLSCILARLLNQSSGCYNRRHTNHQTKAASPGLIQLTILGYH